jgi:hypothetical protein
LKSLRDKATEFDTALSKVKRMNDELVVKAEKALQSISELIGTCSTSTARKCTVCYTRDQTTVLLPCGHVFCASCAERAGRSRCHSCRTRVDSTMRIYVS